jgi:rhodanese-related sulfurtransferase
MWCIGVRWLRSDSTWYRSVVQSICWVSIQFPACPTRVSRFADRRTVSVPREHSLRSLCHRHRSAHVGALQPSPMPTPEELLAIERISADELAALLRSDATRPVIIDVRDEDFDTKGHIVDAEHLPKDNFASDAAVDALVAKFGASKEFVFHCVRSNTRGPTCALRFIERAQALGVKARVRVLQGGFAGFAEVGFSSISQGREPHLFVLCCRRSQTPPTSWCPQRAPSSTMDAASSTYSRQYTQVEASKASSPDCFAVTVGCA